MDDGQRKRFLNALRVVFTPIVRILLHCHIGHKEVVEVLKSTYVDVASKHYGIRGRPTNVSRVAAMSGISRKEVSRIRNCLARDSSDWERPTASTLVLNLWQSDPKYLDSAGRPITLDFEDGDRSFHALVRVSGGDIPAGAIRMELLRAGRVSQDADGRIRYIANSRSNPIADHLISTFQDSGAAILSTLADHATGNDSNQAPLHSKTGLIQNDDIHRFRRILSDRLTEFMGSVEHLFSAYGALKGDDELRPEFTTVKVGCYYNDDTNKSD